MSRRRRRQQRQAVINFVIVAILVGAVGYMLYRLQPVPYDEDTLCLVSDQLPAHTAIIIDKTDAYTEIEAGLIERVIRRSRDQLDVGERITLFELDQAGRFDPRGELTLCNPGRGDQVNPLFNNPRMMEEAYAEKFAGPMDEVLADLVVPKEAPSSPILEAVARLAQTENFSERAPQRRLVLVSDMLQNSDIFTIYGAGGSLPENIPSASATAAAIENRYGSALSGVEIEVRLIQRDRYVDMQRGALKAYWDDVFSDLGVDISWRDL
ncbi:MAG: hypothetical protein AAGJ84_08835 [Pseudomonadota bacterium]